MSLTIYDKNKLPFLCGDWYLFDEEKDKCISPSKKTSLKTKNQHCQWYRKLLNYSNQLEVLYNKDTNIL